VQSEEAAQEARAETAPGFFMRVRHASALGAAPHLNGVRLTLFLPVIYRDGRGRVHALMSAVQPLNSLLFPCSSLLFFSVISCYFQAICHFHVDFLIDFGLTPPPFAGIYRAGAKRETSDCRPQDTSAMCGWLSNFRHALD
jgi:hypothetical protein